MDYNKEDLNVILECLFYRERDIKEAISDCENVIKEENLDNVDVMEVLKQKKYFEDEWIKVDATKKKTLDRLR